MRFQLQWKSCTEWNTFKTVYTLKEAVEIIYDVLGNQYWFDDVRIKVITS